MKYFIPILFFALTGCNSLHQKQLWNDARIGMTPEQVQELYPEAIIPADPSFGAPRRYERLRIGDYTYLGETYKVSFIFDGHQLTQVMLSLVAPPKSPDALMHIARRIEDDLTQRYSTPEKDILKNIVCHFHTAKWTNRRRVISCNAISVRDEAILLNINYRERRS